MSYTKSQEWIESMVALVRRLAREGAAVGVDINQVPPEVYDNLDGLERVRTSYTPLKTVFSDGKGSYVHVFRSEPYAVADAQRIAKDAA